MALYRVPIEITYPGGGGPGANIWHVRTSSDVIGGPDLPAALGWIEQFYTTLNGLFPNVVTIRWEGVATTIGANPTYDTSAPAWSVVGQAGAPMLPPSQALCVSWGTTNASRSGRGRTFLGPVSKDHLQDDGTPGAFILNAIQTAADALIASSSGAANGAVVVYSPTYSIGRDVVSARVRDQFAVLRSRRD